MNASRLLLALAACGACGLSRAPAQIVTIFNDNLDAYADGKADVVYQANYNVPPAAGSFTITSSGGLGGSKSLQNTVDATLVRDLSSSAINYTASDNTRFGSVGIYFQHAGAFGLAGPQIGLVPLPTGSFASGADISGRLNNGKLELRSNNTSILTDTTTATLTNGNWYKLEFGFERTTTTNSFTTTVSLYNSDASGTVGTLIDSIGVTFANATMWSDSQTFAAVRENMSILNLDNFMLTQGVAVPEPSASTALAGAGMLGLAALRRRRRGGR